MKNKEKSWDCCGIEWSCNVKTCHACGAHQPPPPKIGRPLTSDVPLVRVSIRLDPNDLKKLVKKYRKASTGVQVLVRKFANGI